MDGKKYTCLRREENLYRWLDCHKATIVQWLRNTDSNLDTIDCSQSYAIGGCTGRLELFLVSAFLEMPPTTDAYKLALSIGKFSSECIES
mgnify:CR=1 FL=1